MLVLFVSALVLAVTPSWGFESCHLQGRRRSRVNQYVVFVDGQRTSTLFDAYIDFTAREVHIYNGTNTRPYTIWNLTTGELQFFTENGCRSVNSFGVIPTTITSSDYKHYVYFDEVFVENKRPGEFSLLSLSTRGGRCELRMAQFQVVTGDKYEYTFLSAYPADETHKPRVNVDPSTCS